LIQILDEDRWKLNLLLGGRFESEEIPPVYAVSVIRNLGADGKG
jgi:hypothetical protein